MSVSSRVRFSLLFAVALAVLVVGRIGATDSAAARPATRGYIVVLEEGLPAAAQAHSAARRFPIAVRHVYSHALSGYAFRGAAATARAIARQPGAAFVSRDRRVHAVGTMPVVGSDAVPTGVPRIGAGAATTVHEASTTGVAVIDTGINLSHPDLNAVAGKNCVNSRKAPEDDNGHGSHVAGTVAARNNGLGVVGVAPDTKVYAVKVLNAAGYASGTLTLVGGSTSRRTLPPNHVASCARHTAPYGMDICRCTTITWRGRARARRRRRGRAHRAT